MGIRVQTFKLSSHIRICLKKMAYIRNYSPQDFNEYVDEMIGNYSAQLNEEFFTDKEKTTYLEAVKYSADIVWHKYNTKQDQDPTLALVNTDVLDVVLLSLHPKGQIRKKDISDASKSALSECTASHLSLVMFRINCYW